MRNRKLHWLTRRVEFFVFLPAESIAKGTMPTIPDESTAAGHVPPAGPPELADIFRRYGGAFGRLTASRLSAGQQRALRELAVCQTAVLGGHRQRCTDCGHPSHHYNSCRNRHCGRCQIGQRVRWRVERIDELLDVEYFHVVMTLPDQLAQLAIDNPRVVYDILCRAAAQAILDIGRCWKGLRAAMGIILVLHTWGQLMNRHPHAHCLVPGGGISLDGKRWVWLPRGFFLPKKLLRCAFRDTYLQMLEKAYRKGKLLLRGRLAHLQQPGAFAAWVARLGTRRWITHARAVDGSGGSDRRERTVGYLARYATGVAMSNRRIVSIDGGQVTFTYKDYRKQDDPGKRVPVKKRTMPAVEFIGRFLWHVLPHGMRHIRGYGFMVPGKRAENLRRIRQMLGTTGKEAKEESGGQSDEPLDGCSDEDDAARRCPACGRGLMVRVWSLPRPRVSDIMAMRLGDLFQIRLAIWDEF